MTWKNLRVLKLWPSVFSEKQKTCDLIVYTKDITHVRVKHTNRTPHMRIRELMHARLAPTNSLPSPSPPPVPDLCHHLTEYESYFLVWLDSIVVRRCDRRLPIFAVNNVEIIVIRRPFDRFRYGPAVRIFQLLKNIQICKREKSTAWFD